jgi:DNA-directed RNA polymerase sigma subunit (sigma70/sigma32)
VELALSRIEPIHRFVIESRMRGATLRRVAELVGWRHSERARQVESTAFQRLRHPSRNLELREGYKAMMAERDAMFDGGQSDEG